MTELSDTFTEGLLKKQLEYRSVPDYGPELVAMVKVGSRVVRGRNWVYDDDDCGPGGQGTVTRINEDETVDIRWDHGKQGHFYMLGLGENYTIKFAP